MNCEKTSARYLVIVPPTGALLNTEKITQDVMKKTGVENLILLKETDTEVHGEHLIIWVHKDAPKLLPPEIHALMRNFSSSVTLLCTCPECSTTIQRQILIEGRFDIVLAANQYCEDCGERSMP